MLKSISLLLTTAVFIFFASAMAIANCQFQNERTWNGSEDVYRVAETASECEVLPGVWAQTGATIVWFSNGQIQRVTQTGRDSIVAPGIVVQPEAYVSWYKSGQISYVQLLKADTQVKPGIWARRTGSSVAWYENGNLMWVEILTQDFSTAKKCQTAYFNTDGTLASVVNSYMWPVCN